MMGPIKPEALEALRRIYSEMGGHADTEHAKEMKSLYGEKEAAPDVEEVPGAVGDENIPAPEGELGAEADAPTEDLELTPELLQALFASEEEEGR